MKKHYSLLLALLFIFTIGCSSDPLDIDNETITTKGPGGDIGQVGPSDSAFDGYEEGSVVLGQDLSSIHSVTSMRAAYNKKYPYGDGQVRQQ